MRKATQSLRWAAKVWEWISIRPRERSREGGGGLNRVTFREQPAQPAYTPASRSNTPSTPSSCTLRKGHAALDGNKLEVKRRGETVEGFIYKHLIPCSHLNKLIMVILSYGVARVDLLIPPGGWSLCPQGLWALFFFCLTGSGCCRHGYR